MSVSNTQSRNLYSANGTQTVFNITFDYVTEADGITPALSVFTVAPTTGVITQKALTTDYTVQASVPSITFLSAPASGTVVGIVRTVPATQPSAFPNQGLQPSSIETALDWIVHASQEETTDPTALTVTTVAGLPALAAPGDRALVTDANAPTWGAVCVGAGTGHPLTPAYFDGLAWRWG